MSRPTRPADASRSTSVGALAVFLFGVPLAVGVLAAIERDVLGDPDLKRYFEHPVEQAEVLLFCCGLCALVGKLFSYLRERAAFRRDLVPGWDGKPVPAAEARTLKQHLGLHGGPYARSYLGRRVAAVLDFVHSRGSAQQLDDQLRSLSDNDALTVDSSYSLLRFINWAIPILGFLGTVLGITGAISGVTPEKLERDLSQVTDGLATAFDTTALALVLTMILMFVLFIVERLEQSVLQSVDQFVDDELAHRFERTASSANETAPVLDAVKQSTQALLAGTQQLVERQANLWAGTVQKVEQRWADATTKQQEKLTGALEKAMEFALIRYGQRLAELEEKLLERNRALLDGINQLAVVLRDTGREQQLALARLSDGLGSQTENLARLQAGEAQLLRLQETMNQNLATLAGADTFEQALQSLTAAIHLLTMRTGASPPLRVVPRTDAA
jgi:biopolymer transport protein ExbB/TolQ